MPVKRSQLRPNILRPTHNNESEYAKGSDQPRTRLCPEHGCYYTLVGVGSIAVAGQPIRKTKRLHSPTNINKYKYIIESATGRRIVELAPRVPMTSTSTQTMRFLLKSNIANEVESMESLY